MKKYKKIAIVILPMVVMFVVAALIFGGSNDVVTGYIKTSTNAVTDTITTAGDSADASLTFDNTTNNWKYLVVDYIQAAAPIKSLVVAGDNVCFENDL